MNTPEQLDRQKIQDKTAGVLYLMDASDNPLMTAAVLVESLIALIEQTKDEHLLSCVVSYLNGWIAIHYAETKSSSAH